MPEENKGGILMASFLLAMIYLSFVSLGLPDALLGAAWPMMQPQLGVPLSCMGTVCVIISGCTVVSSLMADRVNRRFGTGAVTAVSTGMTALALLGFGLSDSFWQLCVLAIPYGLGAGSVDAALNNYVALHYESRHMSWLHCMWGVGTSVGPLIMSCALTGGWGWNGGYLLVALIQLALTGALFWSLPKWKQGTGDAREDSGKPLSLWEIFRIPGAREVMLAFFCYCGMELTVGQWATSFLVLSKGVPAESAAALAGLFYIGLTAGRAVSGFLTLRFSDEQMIRLGQGIIAVGLLLLFGNAGFAIAGFVLIGLGCVPIYPCIIHSTPSHFGADKSQAVIGVQMASAYVGNCTLPPLFALLADRIGTWLLPVFALAILGGMVLFHEGLQRICAKNP